MLISLSAVSAMNNKLSLKGGIFKSAIILTIAGVLSKLLGFYFRILLTNYTGAAGVGLFQMCIPLIALAFAVCCSGFSVAVSKYSASSPSLKWLFCVLKITISLSIAVMLLFLIFSDFIANHIFIESRCEGIIRITAISLPFMCIHNCLSNYYYSQKESFLPASSQLVEQLVRIGTIILYVRIKNVSTISIADAVTGNIFGEFAAATYCAIPLFFRSIHNKSMTQKLSCSLREYRYIVKYAFPINANQTVLHLLEGAEAILIPAILCMHGLSKDDAISQFGILTGMALPLVLFPCTAANSFALMLLPKVSDESSNVLSDHLAVTVKRTVSMCLSLGIISIFLFINYGARLGAMMFHEDSVYIYTCILSWLCPFLYLKISLTSVTNGMGHTALTFIINITGIIIRLACVFLLIPKLGITGYLYGVLISNICMSLLYIFNIYKKLNIQPDPFGSIIVPLCIAVISIFSSRIICRIVFGLIIKEAEEYTLLLTGAAICCIVYIILFIHEQSEQRPL